MFWKLWFERTHWKRKSSQKKIHNNDNYNSSIIDDTQFNYIFHFFSIFQHFDHTIGDNLVGWGAVAANAAAAAATELCRVGVPSMDSGEVASVEVLEVLESLLLLWRLDSLIFILESLLSSVVFVSPVSKKRRTQWANVSREI